MLERAMLCLMAFSLSSWDIVRHLPEHEARHLLAVNDGVSVTVFVSFVPKPPSH